MAKKLDVKTINGSRVTPKTAGIESTLKHTKQTETTRRINVPMPHQAKVDDYVWMKEKP